MKAIGPVLARDRAFHFLAHYSYSWSRLREQTYPFVWAWTLNRNRRTAVPRIFHQGRRPTLNRNLEIFPEWESPNFGSLKSFVWSEGANTVALELLNHLKVKRNAKNNYFHTTKQPECYRKLSIVLSYSSFPDHVSTSFFLTEVTKSSLGLPCCSSCVSYSWWESFPFREYSQNSTQSWSSTLVEGLSTVRLFLFRVHAWTQSSLSFKMRRICWVFAKVE